MTLYPSLRFLGHYFAYKQGVLRYQPPDVESAANEVVKALKLSDLAQECRVSEPLAILNDLDHGQHVDYANDIDCSTDVPLNFPPNNTFAASDCILVEEMFERVEIPQYRYRYDLEGFLYVLIWVVNHCEPGSKRKRLTQRDLASWETCYDIDKHQRTKSAIRYYFDDEYGVESFQQLGQEWVRPMLYLYEEVTRAPLSWFRSTTARSSEELQARREARQAKWSSESWKEHRDGLLTFQRHLDLLVPRTFFGDSTANRCRYIAY